MNKARWPTVSIPTLPQLICRPDLCGYQLFSGMSIQILGWGGVCEFNMSRRGLHKLETARLPATRMVEFGAF